MPTRPVIKIIQNRDFVTSTAEKSVYSVAVHMKRYGAGAVMIVDDENGELIGICTERDLAFKVIANGMDPKTTPVGQVMTPHPESIGPAMLFGHALHLMHEGGFRHLPVVDPKNRPIGIVSARDALGLEMLKFRHELETREALTEVL